MSGHLSLLVLDFNDPGGTSAAFLDELPCFDISRLLDHRAAWNHVLASTPADLTLLLLPSDEGRGLHIMPPDLLNHIRTCWTDTPIIAWSLGVSAPMVQRIEGLGVDRIVTGTLEPPLLLTAVADHIEQILDQHIEALNQQHTQIARVFRDLNHDCENGVSLSKFQHFTQLLVDHFAFEEDFMHRHGYEGISEHAAGHQRLINLSNKMLSQCSHSTTGVEDEIKQGFHAEMVRHIEDDGIYLAFIERIREKAADASEQPTIDDIQGPTEQAG